MKKEICLIIFLCIAIILILEIFIPRLLDIKIAIYGILGFLIFYMFYEFEFLFGIRLNYKTPNNKNRLIGFKNKHNFE